MENILMIYATALGIVISVLALYVMRCNETLSRKWARVRVRIDENPRRQVREPEEEEVDTHSPLEWLLLGGMFLLLVMLVNAA